MTHDGLNKSKYNSALSQIYRMDNLYQRVSEYTLRVQYAKVNEVLDRIWLELVARANDKQKEEMDNINNELSNLYIYGLSENLKLRNKRLYDKIVSKQRQVLQKKEMHIREVQESQGKGGSYEDDIADYMD